MGTGSPIQTTGNIMIPNRTNDRYHPLSIAVHWLTLALLIAVYALIELRGI